MDQHGSSGGVSSNATFILPTMPYTSHKRLSMREKCCSSSYKRPNASLITLNSKFRPPPNYNPVTISSINISAVGSLLLAISYGTKLKPQNDSRVIIAEQMTDCLSESLTPISILLDTMPFLVPFISPFLPRAAFSKSKAEWSDMVSRFRNDPFKNVLTLVVSYFPF